MNKKKLTFIIITIILLFIISICYFYKIKTGNQNNNFDLNDIKKVQNKVNIYLFWGDGCPHCKNEHEYLKSLKKEYGKYFNLYVFEVWYSEANAKLMFEFALANNEDINSIPYTIIGSKTFNGFNDSMKKDLLDAILEEKDSNIDIYIDKIKNK